MRLVPLQLLFLLILGLPTWALNPAWIRKDKQMITEVNELLKATPATTERYFLSKDFREAHDLGFGWMSKQTAVHGGYTSVYATFYYRNDSLVSYVIHPELPDEPTLQSTYTTWYAPRFRINAPKLNAFYVNSTALSAPLLAYVQSTATEISTKAIREYMSPEAGIVYGYAGGESRQILENRAAFLDLRATLLPEQVVLLMYAINPASRLTAFEFYLRNKALFSNQQQIEQWMEVVFRTLPKVESISGCIGGNYDVQELMADFIDTH